ncbi:MAG: PD40 domain-containing protein [Chloroflexi bacterium]|nr:PD40 domain-containing protein [Chloroflexota bacterium]
MVKQKLFMIVLFLVLLSGCLPPVTRQPNPSTPTAEEPSPTNTLMIPTPLLQPTEMATLPPQDDLIIQNCVNVLPNVPAGFITTGIVPLEDFQTWSTAFLELSTNDKSRIPNINGPIADYAISPDRKTLAYKTHLPSQFNLTLTDALNVHKQIIFSRQLDYALYYWLNNEELLLGKNNQWVVFNPYTKQERGYSLEDFPDYDTYNQFNVWVGLDPQETLAIYKNENNNTSLLNIVDKQLLAEIPDNIQRPPIASWTLDGKEAAIVGATQVGQYWSEAGDNIFGVGRDGQVTQLTNLAEHYGEGFNIYSLSWSPDSRYISFWMWYPGVSSNDWVLGVLDTSTKRVTDYCISTDPYATNDGRSLPGLSAPIWSPDGKQIIVEHRTNDSKYVVLLDIAQNVAFQIAQNSVPLGWMLSEP